MVTDTRVVIKKKKKEKSDDKADKFLGEKKRMATDI